MRHLERRLRKLEEAAQAAASNYCPPRDPDPPGLLEDIAELAELAVAGSTEVPPHLQYIGVCMDTVRWLRSTLDELGPT